jgi:HPr kinase/phosphorylase
VVKRVNIHATCVQLGAAGKAFGASATAGILLLGDSGSGKSDLVLRLIERGAKLVADDRVDLFVENGRLWAAAPKRIAGYLEVRGLGVIELPYTEKVRIALAVRLSNRIARMPVHKSYNPPKPLEIAAARRPPLISINPFEPSATVKIVVATAAFANRLFRENVKPD